MDLSLEQEISPSLVVLYAAVSFVCVMLVILLIYISNTRRYRLNWFEQNLLENAADMNKDTQQLNKKDELLADSKQDLSGTFWVPTTAQKLRQHTEINDSDTGEIIFKNEETPLVSPTLTETQLVCKTSNNITIAANDREMVLVRPKLPSMQANLDHTKINTSLYNKESPNELEITRGCIHLTLAYDTTLGMLTVRLIEANDLQARDFSGTADPYAKIRLLPDKTNVWQTRIHKKTLNPVFDEDFVFEVTPSKLPSHQLEILVYDFDAYSRHQAIGALLLPLCDYTNHLLLSTLSLVPTSTTNTINTINTNLTVTMPTMPSAVSVASVTSDVSATGVSRSLVDIWQPLSVVTVSPDEGKISRGEVMVSVTYLSAAGRLTVVVIKARNLRVVDDTRNSSDPYVKLYLINGTKRIKKKKTNVQRNTLNPIFNEALTFDVSKNVMKNCILELSVFHDNLLGNSELLGTCRIGNTADCNIEEKDFFTQILRSKTATAKWLTLADNGNHKS